jgi:hypothetical protein
MNALAALIASYDALRPASDSAELKAARDELVAMARKERTALIRGLSFALPRVDMTNPYARVLGQYHAAQELLKLISD